MWFEHSEIPMLFLQGTTEKGFKSSSGVGHAPCEYQNSLFGFKRRAIVQPSSAQSLGEGGGFRADENGKHLWKISEGWIANAFLRSVRAQYPQPQTPFPGIRGAASNTL
jgi:hypothetical protein